MIQAIKEWDVTKLKSFVARPNSYSQKELNYCYFAAAQTGQLDCIKCLLSCSDLDVNGTNSAGKTALMLSAEYGHFDVLCVLIIIPDFSCRINQKNSNTGKTALHYAVEFHQTDCVYALLDAGASTSITDKLGNTPLILACSSRFPDLEIMKCLTKKNKRDINIQNKQGQTALHCTSSKAIGTEMLLASEANPNLPDIDGNTPLHIASIEGLDSIVTCLITYNCDVNIRNNFGKLALHYLAMKGHESCVELVSKVGGLLNELDNENKSPLIYSIENKRFKAFVSLLTNNCCPDLCRPLELAFRKKLYIYVMLLLLVGGRAGPFWEMVKSSENLKERFENAMLEDYDEDDVLIKNKNNNGTDPDIESNESDSSGLSNQDEINQNCYLDWSLRYITHCPSLKHLCRCQIKRLIRSDGNFKNMLPSSLPPLLHDYVLFKGNYSLYNYYRKEHLNARI